MRKSKPTIKILGVIPSRYHSTRLPAKALADLEGKSLVQRVYERVASFDLLDELIIATDHLDIVKETERFGAKTVLTSDKHPSGTDRCCEVLDQLNHKPDYVINIQGDEPFIEKEHLEKLIALLDGQTEIASLICPIKDPATLDNPSMMKVVVNKNWEALYFSRSCIPFIRNHAKEEWLKYHTFYKHIGLYAYRQDILKSITSLPPSSLEQAESLEQLRWLEHGYRIKLALCEKEVFGIDTPEDLAKARHILKKKA